MKQRPVFPLALVLLLLLLSLAGAPARGQPSRPCEQPVRYSAAWFPSPEIDHGKSAAQISTLGTAAKGRGLQLGHVVVETRLSVQPQEGCAGVVVRLDFDKPVLRVAREFPADSCAYARVMNHENTHVRIWREIAERFRALSYPWPAGARSEAILTLAKQHLASLVRAQQEFDSPEEYAKNASVCGGEIGRLVKPGR